MNANGKQAILKLDIPPELTHEDRMKALMDLVLDNYDGDLSAYFEFIRPREQTEDPELDRMALVAGRAAKCL